MDSFAGLASNLLPGAYVAALAVLLAGALRRWYDPVPRRVWWVWAAALLPVFAPVLLGGRVLLPLGYLTRVPPFTHLWPAGETPPGNLAQSDLVLLIAPWWMRVREAVGSGSWPLWNHLAGAGEPLLANPQAQALQPLLWLAAPFPVAAGAGIVAALRILLAFGFTYLLLRRQGISEPPALWASLAYGLAGFLQLWLGWPLAGSAALLPCLLYGLVLVAERGARRDLLLVVCAVACLLAGGHPETELHVLALGAAFGLSRLLAGRRAGGQPAGPLHTPGTPRTLRTTAGTAARWLAAAATGACLAAPALLPAAVFVPQSLRAALLAARRPEIRRAGFFAGWRGGSERGLGGGLHGALSRLVPVAAPNAFGNSRFGSYWGDSNTIEDASAFTGNATLLAFLAGCLPLPGGRPRGSRSDPSRSVAVPSGPSADRADPSPPGEDRPSHPAETLARFPQERLMQAAALACALVLACPPGLVRLFDALPLLRDSLYFHRRVTLLLNFAIAYGAACCWERYRRGQGRWPAALAVAIGLATAVLWGYLAHPAAPLQPVAGAAPGEAQPFARAALSGLRMGSLSLHLLVLASAAAWLLRPARGGARPGRGAFLARWTGTLLVAGELLAIHAPANPSSPARLFYPEVAPVGFLRRHLLPGFRMAGLGPALRPNFASAFGLADARSANPLKPMPYLEATRGINRFPYRPADGFVRPEDPLYGLLGVSYLISGPEDQLGTPLRLVWSGADARVWERPGALPRLFLPAAARLCSAPSWAACTAAASIIDFGAEATVHELPAGLSPRTASRASDLTRPPEPAAAHPGVPSRAFDQLLPAESRRSSSGRFLPAEARRSSEAGAPAMGSSLETWAAADPGGSQLVLARLEPAALSARLDLVEGRLLASSVYQDGGWRLVVDGVRRPGTLANGPFFAAWLPAGARRADLLYRPPAFILGLAAAACGLAATAALLVPAPVARPPRRRNRARSQASTPPLA